MVVNEQVFELLKEKINAVEADVAEIKADVKEMLAFKWQIIGGSVVVSAIVGVAIQVVISILSK